MAFPIPSHLPRRPNPQDISSQILNRIDAATQQSLNSALASSWLSELEQTIKTTKGKIHERIQSDLPEFQRQLAASKSVQERLHTLTTNVDTLSNSVSNPETGIIPTLIESLQKHAKLAQESLDARVEHEALSHLLKCRTALRSLEDLIEEGNLSQAVAECKSMETILQATPAHLNETSIVGDLRRKFRAAQSRNEEQLNDAYTRSVASSQHEFVIYPSVKVRQSEAVISLSSILASLSSASLSSHLTTLRRDLTNNFIDFTLRQSTSVIAVSPSPVDGVTEYKLSLVASPPSEEIRSTQLENLFTVFTFLSNHLFSCLPPSQVMLFTRSLCKPITTSLLQNFLIPSLPSSYESLHSFLQVVQEAVAFEDKMIVGLLGNDPNDRPVKAWADGMSGHYERQRRMQILDRSRAITIALGEPSDTIIVEVDVVLEDQPTVVPVQEEIISPVKEDAWGFDDDPSPANDNPGDMFAMEEDGWGFDEDVIPDEPDSTIEPESSSQLIRSPPVKTPEVSSSPEIINGDDEPDPSEAWGWNEDDDLPPAEETAWDDPWGDEPEPLPEPAVLSPPQKLQTPPPPPLPSIPTISVKAATRLEKAANKSKKPQTNGTPLMSSVTPSTISPIPSPFVSYDNSPMHPSVAQEPIPPSTLHGKRPSVLTMRQPPPKETYVASGRTKRIMGLVEAVLAEGQHLARSSLFPSSSSSSSVGTTLLLSAPAILDLHRALYPIKFSKELAAPEMGMRYANDCAYLAGEVERIKDSLRRDTAAIVGERLRECARHFRVLSESWFQDIIQREQKALDTILTAGAQGFVYTAEQDRYDECESAMTQVLQQVRRLAQRFKTILAKSKYYTAVGMIVDTALGHILTNILALPDIPEVESHRLSELCRIFNAMEGLFVEDPSQPSFVVAYVPSWLKFSYLSELLEASMADITYLFEEGALVDFQVDELVRLVRALFADTPLRTNTIAKLQGEHPTLT
ncbi:hypothetical protein H0H81_006587 [Sphagnurus paluster]|uniref:ZW10 C-terminal helical domain-containing protein n=1 Tax=Sphagnurus paluster TaxID=117069 RepID=A0A9P7FX39_9AGAR|nr:hypothetical protein H0H81_006587 [Sphagnurus paluster]